MHKLDQRGELLIPLVIVTVFLVGSIGFGIWAYMGRQDYKNNVDQKITEAVVVAEENLAIKKDAEFAESYKLPNVTYRGPGAFGTLSITYPKTWSNYVNERGSGNTPVDGIMHPSYVSSDDSSVNYALRYQVVERQYEQELRAFDSKVRNGRISVSAYRLPGREETLGSRLEGEITSRKQGVLVLLPLRDKTIKLWTEGSEFRTDFESILAQATFIP